MRNATLCVRQDQPYLVFIEVSQRSREIPCFRRVAKQGVAPQLEKCADIAKIRDILLENGVMNAQGSRGSYSGLPEDKHQQYVNTEPEIE